MTWQDDFSLKGLEFFPPNPTTKQSAGSLSKMYFIFPLTDDGRSNFAPSWFFAVFGSWFVELVRRLGSSDGSAVGGGRWTYDEHFRQNILVANVRC